MLPKRLFEQDIAGSGKSTWALQCTCVAGFPPNHVAMKEAVSHHGAAHSLDVASNCYDSDKTS